MKNSLIKIAFTTLVAFVLGACAPAANTVPVGSTTEYPGWTKVAHNFYRYEDSTNNIVCYWHWVKDNIHCMKLDAE